MDARCAGVRQLVTTADLIPVIKVAMSRTDEVFGTRNARDITRRLVAHRG
jgi:hypothetical protein